MPLVACRRGDGDELYRLHSKRPIDVASHSPIAGPSVDRRRLLPVSPIASSSPIEDDLDVLFTSKPLSYVLVQPGLIARHDQQMMMPIPRVIGGPTHAVALDVFAFSLVAHCHRSDTTSRFGDG